VRNYWAVISATSLSMCARTLFHADMSDFQECTRVQIGASFERVPSTASVAAVTTTAAGAAAMTHPTTTAARVAIARAGEAASSAAVNVESNLRERVRPPF